MGVPVSSDVNLFGLIFIFLHIIQNVELLVASPVLHSHFQRRLVDDHSGFISIDCGSTTDSYFDNTTGLYYTSDKKYINTGINIIQPQPTYIFNKTLPGFLNLGKTIRQFPEGRRNCYSLSPVTPYNKYFIRAQFLYSSSLLPIFDVYIGVNLWFTLKTSKIISEIIHVATTTSIDVCLVNTNQGIPFISALELRPLDNSSYLVASPQLSLAIRHREDSGGFSVASTTGPYMVKDDAYNRQWFMYYDRNSKTIQTTESFDGSQADPYKVPTSVLSTALEKTNTSPELTISRKLMDPSPQVYYYWHFAELELLGSNDTREFNILVPQDPGYNSGPIRPVYLQVTTVSSPRISYSGQTNFSFTLRKTSNSTLYPILNACEVYFALDLPVSPTIQEDVDAVTEIKDKYAVKRIWQGDPCLPANYQWDGLNCTYGGNINSTRITSLNLSSSNLKGEIPHSLSNLASLTYLNLSNNGFTGEIPEFLSHLLLLTVIDLSENNLTGSVPHALAAMASLKRIDLRLEGNPHVCMSIQCEEKKGSRHHFIIPIVASFASVSLLLISGIIFLKFKRTKKPERFVDRAIKSKSKQFNSSEIVRITDSFRKVLGKGGFGTVYYGVLQDGTEVAVKLLNHTSSTITERQFCAEAELLARIHHVNLVSLIGYCDEHPSMALVYEYMSCGDLQTHLSERNEHPLSWKTRLQISVDAAQGLEYLHCGCQPSIVHRDIKPANILLDDKGHAKIADFGLCRDLHGAAMTEVAGTRGYLDPEYCRLNNLSEKSDVYGFGIVLLQLLTGQPVVIKHTNKQEDEVIIDHIIDWVSRKVESGDIFDIVDERLQGDCNNVSSAMKFFEIAMECVKPMGNQRPRMSEVVADLKLCYASEGFHDQTVLVSVDNGSYNPHSSQGVVDYSLTCVLPR